MYLMTVEYNSVNVDMTVDPRVDPSSTRAYTHTTDQELLRSLRRDRVRARAPGPTRLLVEIKAEE
jgi:hypothetical protein